MADVKTTAENFLRDLLDAGRDLKDKAADKTVGMRKDAKGIAARGEDVLVDKLGFEDTAENRSKLRKGALAGGLALMLFSKSARKYAAIGGLAGLGALAFRAHKRNASGADSTAGVVGHLTGPAAEVRAEALIRAMVAAAKADGKISDDELALIRSVDDSGIDTLSIAVSQAPDAKAVAKLADSDQAGREIYAVSCRIADGLNPKERDYLDQLAMALKLDPDTAAFIETDVRTGV